MSPGSAPYRHVRAFYKIPSQWQCKASKARLHPATAGEENVGGGLASSLRTTEAISFWPLVIFRHSMKRYFKSGKRSESVSQHIWSQRKKVILFASWYLQTQGPDSEWLGCLSLDAEELRREGDTHLEGDKGQMSLIHSSPSSHPPGDSGLCRALQRSRPTLPCAFTTRQDVTRTSLCVTKQKALQPRCRCLLST